MPVDYSARPDNWVSDMEPAHSSEYGENVRQTICRLSVRLHVNFSQLRLCNHKSGLKGPGNCDTPLASVYRADIDTRRLPIGFSPTRHLTIASANVDFLLVQTAQHAVYQSTMLDLESFGLSSLFSVEGKVRCSRMALTEWSRRLSSRVEDLV